MLSNKDFCSKDCSLNLKKLGFNERTFGYYTRQGEELIRISSQFRGSYAEDCSFSHNSLPDDCLGYDNIDTPTHYDAQRWLREAFNIDVEVSNMPSLKRYCFMVADENSILIDSDAWDMLYHTYETALNEGILWATKELLEKKYKIEKQEEDDKEGI